MSDPARLPRMTSDEFIAWALQQPKGKRYELYGGEVVPMAPERSVHALMKLRVARRLAEAVEAAGLPCEVFPDGMTVVVDEHTSYEPDAMIRCGESLPDDAVVLDPVVVVEVTSPSTQSLDTGDKLADYFRVPTVRHYLIVRTKQRAIVLHSRGDADGTITTRIIRDGTVELDPPGIAVRGLFD